MAVYVDQPIDWGVGSVKGAARVRYWCHMMADTQDELHEMAVKIGLKRSWFQGPPAHRTPHYDITKSRRAVAIKHGAIDMGELPVLECLDIIKAARESK